MKLSLIATVFIFTLLQVLASTPAHAGVLDLIVREPIKVRKKPKRRSKVVTKLQRGDKVVISAVEYGAWRKVLVTYDGKRQSGYIRKKDMHLSRIEERIEGEINFFKKNMSIAVNAGLVFQMRGEQPLQLNGYNEAHVGSQKGFSTQFGLQIHYPIAELMLLQASIQQRKIILEGTGETIKGSGSRTFEINEDMISAGGFIKLYDTADAFFWKGAGLDLGFVSSVDVRHEGGGYFEFIGEFPLYVIAVAGFGWDIPLTPSVYLLPEFKTSVFVNSDPIMFSAEAYMSLAWTF